MNSDAVDRFLDRAERALRSSFGGRRQSEMSFLQALLRDMGADVAAVGMPPAALFRALLHDRARDVLEVVARPSQRPDNQLRPGDWMLRAVPGTGDVGHVAVLASDDLLAQPMLASEGIAAESVQPGHYGLVIEVGAFRHSRSRPFARRWLDSRGCVPPHTVVLRPKYSNSMADFRPEESADIDEEYVPSVGAAERQPAGGIPKGHREVIGRLDLDNNIKHNTIMRARVESVAKELDIDPGLFAATLVAEKGFAVWSKTSGTVSGEDLGLDDWFDKVKDKTTGVIKADNINPPIEKKIIKEHPNLGLKFEDVQETGDWWDTSTEKPGGLLKPRMILDAKKAVAAAGVYYKLQEKVLRQAIQNTRTGQSLDDLLPEERLTLLRLAFNGGVGTARNLFVQLVNGGDIPRSGSTERDPGDAVRTAVLHMARGIHLDQAVFGRPSSDYRPTVKTILRRMGATISIENPPPKS